MSLYIGIIGIDGSGKSLVTLAAAEPGLTTAAQVKTRSRPGMVFGNGHLLLTSGGWAGNYRSPSGPIPGDTTTSTLITPNEVRYDYVEIGDSLSPDIGWLIPGLKLMRYLLIPSGVPLAECFRPQVAWLSGKYLGYYVYKPPLTI
jgi:hypothetical protein